MDHIVPEIHCSDTPAAKTVIFTGEDGYCRKKRLEREKGSRNGNQVLRKNFNMLIVPTF